MIRSRNLGTLAGMLAAVSLTAGALIASTASAETAAQIGEPAPIFTGTTALGESVSLEDYAGKTVVLEWTNHGCPFVKKHYAEPPANMQTLQASSAEDDIVWLSIVSSAPGKQGYVTGEEAVSINEGRGASPEAVILDPTGDIGRLYDAKTTPHMYVIDAEGVLQYKGAIDSVPSAKVEDIETADNYVSAALESVQAGEAVEIASTRAYGCSVKF